MYYGPSAGDVSSENTTRSRSASSSGRPEPESAIEKNPDARKRRYRTTESLRVVHQGRPG